MDLPDETIDGVIEQYGYDELEVLDHAARELGLGDADHLVRDLLRKAELIREQEPRTPEDPANKLDAPGLGTGPEARDPSAREVATEKVSGKSLSALRAQTPSLATRMFQRVRGREHDQER